MTVTPVRYQGPLDIFTTRSERVENSTSPIRARATRAASSVGREESISFSGKRPVQRKEVTSKVGTGMATSDSPNAGHSAQRIGGAVSGSFAPSAQKRNEDVSPKITGERTLHSPNVGDSAQRVAGAVSGIFTPSAQKKNGNVSPKITGERTCHQSQSRAASAVPFPMSPQYTTEQERILNEAMELFRDAERLGNEGNLKGSTDKLIDRVKILQDGLPNSLALARAYSDLGSAREKGGDLDRALTCYERAMPVFEQKIPNTAELVKFYENFAVLCEGLYNIPRALEYYEKSCSILRGLNPNPADLATLHDKIAHLLEMQGHPSRALELRLRNVPVYEEKHPGSLELAQYYELIASSFGTDKVKEMEYLQKCVEIEAKSSPDKFADTIRRIRKLYEDKEKLEDTFISLMKGFSHETNRLPTLVSQTSSYTYLSGVRQTLIKLREAINKFERLLRKKIELAPNLVMAAYCEVLGDIYAKPGQDDLSRKFYRSSLTIRENLLGADHPEVIALSTKIIALPGKLASMSQARNGSVVRGQSVIPAREKLCPLIKDLTEYKSGFFSKNDKDRAAERLKTLLIEYQALQGEAKESKYSEVSGYVNQELDRGKANPLFSGIVNEALYTLFVRCGRLFPSFS